MQVLRVLARSTSSRRCFSTAASEGAPSVEMFQYKICPFCNKAKALLSYANVPYQAVEVNPLTKAEIKW